MLKWLVNSGWWLGNRHSPLRRGISLVFSLLSLALFLSACTDYVSQIEDRYGEWVTTGSITDSRDNQTYKTVTIASQTWMAENLNYETENSSCFKDRASNCSMYGRFYTWSEAVTACPIDWHLPTKAEFETLFAAVGGQSIASTKLKSTNDRWFNNDGSTDAYFFAALPAGYRDFNGSYLDDGTGAYFWSSTKNGSDYAYGMYLINYNANAGLYYNYDKNFGFSVRCVKDESDEKSSSSKHAKSSSSTSASSSSKKVGSSSSIAKSSSSVKKSSSSKKTESSSSAAKSSSSVAKSSSSKVAEPAEVKTGSITDSRDGQIYKTVTIGIQTWMAQNLNYETANSYCYSDTPSNCTKYGRLYTWAAAMDSTGLWSANGKGCGYGLHCLPTYPVRGVCPSGWHLPTKAEFETLFTEVGGQTIAGKVLKSVSGWDYSGNGTDDFSFSALQTGYRSYNGNYFSEGGYANFWSSTEYDSSHAYNMSLYYDYDLAYLDVSYKYYGFSVRCVKDE